MDVYEFIYLYEEEIDNIILKLNPRAKLYLESRYLWLLNNKDIMKIAKENKVKF